MSQEAPWSIQPLTSARERSAFSSGEPSLDRYLHQKAGQDIRRDVARVYVCVSPSAPARIAGYYTLSAASIERATLPEQRAKRLPPYPVPAALLGRLAVASSAQGKGLGGLLLADALQRIDDSSRALAIHALIVDALNEAAAAFYRRHGFQPFPNTSLRLFLPLETYRRGGS